MIRRRPGAFSPMPHPALSFAIRPVLPYPTVYEGPIQTTSGEPILKITGLTKDYGGFRALDHISFSVGQGEIVGLLGPNGAGKTTTINMVLGILKSTEGTIEVMGKNLNKRRSDIGRYVNFAAVYAQVPANLTVRQNLFVFALLYGVRKIKKKLAALMREFDLERFADKKAGLLSSGEMSRLNLAKAVMNSPRLLLLDEPTASLDPSISMLVREKIKEYVRVLNAGILWTSHNMSEIERFAIRCFSCLAGRSSWRAIRPGYRPSTERKTSKSSS